MIIKDKKDVGGTGGKEVFNDNTTSDCKKQQRFSPNIVATTDRNENSAGENNDLDKFTEQIHKLRLDSVSSSSDSSSSSEDEADDENLIPKCPDKIKDQSKQRIRSQVDPYPTTRPFFHGSGGVLIDNGGIEPRTVPDVPQNFSHYNIPFQVPQIPATVEEISDKCISNETESGLDDSDVAKFITMLNHKQQTELNEVIDRYLADTSIPQEPAQDYLYTQDASRSVDSTYGTLSSPESCPIMSPPHRSPGSQAYSGHRLSTDSDTIGLSTSPFSDNPGACSTDTLGSFIDNTYTVDKEFLGLFNYAEDKGQNGARTMGPARPFESFNRDRQSVPSEMKPPPPTVTIPPPFVGSLGGMQNTTVNIPTKERPIGVPPLTSVPAPSPRPPPPPSIRFSAPVSNVLPNIRPGGVPVPEVNMLQSAMERIKPLLNNQRLTVIWTRILLLKDKVFQADECGQTSLMKAIRNLHGSPGFLEEIHCLLTLAQRENQREYLKTRNTSNHTALYIAAVEYYEKPLIARCLTDVLISLDEDPDEVYDEQHNSVLHMLCTNGDSRAGVVAELLNAKWPKDQRPCFNVNRSNLLGESPLHTAVKTHNNAYPSLTIAKLLISHGASIAAQDSNGITPLMAAVRGQCDPGMVNILLKSNFYVAKDVVNMRDRQHNTALHHAASNNVISMARQIQVVSELINAGATHNSHNMSGRVALSLVDSSRKDAIRSILHRGNRKS